MSFLKRNWPWPSQNKGRGVAHETKETMGALENVDFSLGIKELAPGISPVVDIVAIHGLDGHREHSWTAENGVSWLRDLVAPEIPTARILTYGYDANTRNKERLSKVTLFDHAETFVSKLVLFRQKPSLENRPIIFVAHSLGGIILKHALIKASSATASHLHDHRSIYLSTYGILFLGTPHQGADAVDLALSLLRIWSIFTQTNDTLLQHLQRDSEFLQSQISLYASISGHFDTKFYFEMYPTYILGGKQKLLVPKSSAVVPGAVNAEAIGIHKDHIGMAKFMSSEDDDFQIICGHLVSMVSKAPWTIAEKWRQENRHEEIDLLAQPNITYQPPYLCSPRFTGRRDYLTMLNEYFQPQPNKPQDRKAFLLYGMGGAGKTQICLKFIEECSDQYWRIFWVDASSVETIKLSLEAIAGDSEAQASGVDKSAESVLQWMSGSTQKWLLVFDNAGGDPDIITKFMPYGKQGNILITSRNPSMRQQSPGAWSEVGDMGEEDAISLLLKTSCLDETSNDLRKASRSIVTELCFLPLAVDQAGALIENGTCSIHNYLQMYNNTIQRLHLMANPIFKGASKYGQAVYGTWDLSYQAIEARAGGQHALVDIQAAKSAILILNTFGFLHHNNITEEIFERAARPIYMQTYANKINTKEQEPLHQPHQLLQLDRKGKWDVLFFRVGIRVLLSFSFIQRDTSGSAYSVHPLVHSWSRDRMLSSESQTMCLSVKRLLTCSIPDQFEFKDYTFRGALLPHVKAIYQYAAEADIPQVYDDDEYINFGLVFHENRYGVEAEKLFSEVAETRKRLLGPEHPDTLAIVDYLAQSLAQQGQWKRAEGLQIEVVEMSKKILGEKHPKTLIGMKHLAVTVGKLFKWKEVKELIAQINELETAESPLTLSFKDPKEVSVETRDQWNEEMELVKKCFGAEHPATLASLTTVAERYWTAEQYREAEELQVQVMEKTMKILGQEHPDTLMCMGNLALTYWKQEHWRKAENLLARAIDMMTRVLGNEHPNTLKYTDNLVSIHVDQKQWKKAEELHIKLVDIRKRALGIEHPLTLRSMAKLASTYKSQKKWKETEELNNEVMGMLEKDDPIRLISMHCQVTAYMGQEKWKEAEELLLPTLEMTKDFFGAEHEHTLMAVEKLIETYSAQKQWKKAEKLGVEVVEVKKKLLGPENPDTLTSMNNLAFLFRDQEKWTEANELQTQVLEMRQKLDPHHIDTLITMVNLAHIQKLQGEEKLAMDLIQSAERMCTEAYGVDHPHTIKLTDAINISKG